MPCPDGESLPLKSGTRKNTPELPPSKIFHSSLSTKSPYIFLVPIQPPPGLAMRRLSFTDHLSLSPAFDSRTSQPSRSLPLNKGTKPPSPPASGGNTSPPPAAATPATAPAAKKCKKGRKLKRGKCIKKK